jgi:hypothetical protein
VSRIADTPSSEEPTPRGTGDAAEAEQRPERGDAEVSESSAADEETDAIETLKKRTHPFD